MKFSQVPVGQPFEFQGVRYVKTSPVVATEEASGRSRFLGKYVEVTLSLGPREAKRDETAAPSIDAAGLAEFEVFHGRCLAILDRLQGSVNDADALALARAELEEARKQFLSKVGGNAG